MLRCVRARWSAHSLQLSQQPCAALRFQKLTHLALLAALPWVEAVAHRSRRPASHAAHFIATMASGRYQGPAGGRKAATSSRTSARQWKRHHRTAAAAAAAAAKACATQVSRVGVFAHGRNASSGAVLNASTHRDEASPDGAVSTDLSQRQLRLCLSIPKAHTPASPFK